MQLENAKPHTQVGLDTFYEELKFQYEVLFKCDPDYAYAASITTPEALARKMVLALDAGTANKDGKAIKFTCKKFGIPHTYKAIRTFLNS